jgi:methionyl-tRNA synthetase
MKNEHKQDQLDHVLYQLIETIRYVATLLQPFIPQTAAKIAAQVGFKDLSFESLESWGQFKEQTLGKAEVLFERYDLAKKLAEILEDQHE